MPSNIFFSYDQEEKESFQLYNIVIFLITKNHNKDVFAETLNIKRYIFIAHLKHIIHFRKYFLK